MSSNWAWTKKKLRPTPRSWTILGADSLDEVELLMVFEEEFGLEIPDEDAEKISRVKDAVEYIESHAKGGE